MSTNWMPTVGRGWVPGSVGLAFFRASRVAGANAAAALVYSGFEYSEARLPDGTVAQPVFWPTRFSYCDEEAQEMNFQAASALVVFFSIIQDQAYSQPEDLVSLTGACA